VEDVRHAFGRRVRELRIKRGLTQEGLAERAGLHWTYVGGIERGKRNPALDNINRLARALSVPLTELFSGFSTGLASSHRRKPRRTQSPKKRL
jgi:transcriptional regulator with XRE-family HTH domain